MTVQIDTTSENNGVRLVQQNSHPSAPSSGHELLYIISGSPHGGLFVKDSDGRQIGPFLTGTNPASVVVTGSFIMSSRPYGTFLRSYDFSTGVQGWTAGAGTITGTYDSVSSYLHYDGTGINDTAAEPNSAANIADGEFICDFRYVSGTDGGICWRYTDNNNYYMVFISATALSFYKKVSGGYTGIAEIDINGFPGYNIWHKLMVRFVGTRMTIWINDAYCYSIVDSSLSTGRVGVRNQNSLIDIANIKLYSLSSFDSRLATV